jgi:hypothetical protein
MHVHKYMYINKHQGGDYDIIAIGLQESTYTVTNGIKATMINKLTEMEQQCISHLTEEFCTLLGRL